MGQLELKGVMQRRMRKIVALCNNHALRIEQYNVVFYTRQNDEYGW
jgi:hypothetical protein